MSTTVYAARPGLRTSAEWVMGDAAQHRWAEYLLQRGWTILPAYRLRDQDTGLSEAPCLRRLAGNLLLPDLLIFRDGRGQWAEIKAKGGPCWSRARGCWVHAADSARVEDYEAVLRVSGLPVHIVLWEATSPIDPTRQSALRESGIWLVATLDQVLDSGWHAPTWPGGSARPHLRGSRGRGGWLWPRACMRSAVEEEVQPW